MVNNLCAAPNLCSSAMTGVWEVLRSELLYLAETCMLYACVYGGVSVVHWVDYIRI